jgi:hypothetical protein
MLRPVKITRRLVALLAGLALLALLAEGCTGSQAGGGERSGGPGSGGETPTTVVTGPPGTVVYLYENAGLTATLVIKGETGSLEIDNGTGRDLPKPGFYILDARNGSHTDGHVADAAPIPDGDKASFGVSFTGIEDKNIGLVVLLMGPANYGAFVQQ